MDAIFKGLTPPQAAAVSHIDGPLLILAGPGSGKTRVVTHRIAHMLNQGILPQQILALTFTNKAADEMRQRVNHLAPGKPVWMGTFHRFCARQLRRYASMVGLSENYSIYDSGDAKQAIKRAIEAADVSTSHTSPEQIAAAISNAKNRLITPDMMSAQYSHKPADSVAARVYPIYQQQLLIANAVDFDDLLLHFARLLRENPEVRGDLDSRFKYIMVDEYQDTNLAQYAIVRALSVDQPNLAVTGDPDQSIYGWRGADLNNILDFEKDYPNVRVVRLEQNYRSTPNILSVADHLIRHNRRRKAKELFTDNPGGEPVVMRMYESGYEEADDIADQIVRSVATEGVRPRDFAVFCRMNALTRTLEHAFRRRGLPYQIINGLEFYQRREIKDLMAYLNLINNPDHDVALTRVINTPTRGIGDKTIQRIRWFADRHGISMLQASRRCDEIDDLAKRSKTMVHGFVSLYDRLRVKATATVEDLLRYLVEETRFNEYLERSSVEQSDNNPIANVDELISAAVEFDLSHPEDGSLELFLEQTALVADSDAFEESSDRVTVMTMHASKGLEFPRVFLIAVENGLLPHARACDSEAEIEEERRLLFVAITRAKERLQLSFCKRRTVRGDERPAIASPFFTEMPRGEMRIVETDNNEDWFDQDAGDYPESWDLGDDGVATAGDDGSFLPDELCQLPDEERRDEERRGEERRAHAADDRVQETASAAGGLTHRRPAIESPTPSRRTGGSSDRSQNHPRGVPKASLKTAADLMADGGSSLAAYREGSLVKHPDYGQGTIVTITGRGPKRNARVRFDDREANFLIAYSDLELV